MGPVAEQEDAVYRPRLPPLWRVPDALARMQALLPGLLAAAAAGQGSGGAVSLWSFLPGPEALEAAGLASAAVPDAALLSRSGVASTLVAGLELARQGRITLAQEEGFGTVLVHGAPGLPSVGQDREACPADAALMPSSSAAAAAAAR